MVQFIRLGPSPASQPLLSESQREAARTAPNLAQPIILACGTCASAKISRHLVGAWLYVRHCAKIKSTSTIQYKLS